MHLFMFNWIGECRLYRWLTARLQYLQCVSNGDTTVLHQAIDMGHVTMAPIYRDYYPDGLSFNYCNPFGDRAPLIFKWVAETLPQGDRIQAPANVIFKHPLSMMFPANYIYFDMWSYMFYRYCPEWHHANMKKPSGLRIKLWYSP